MGYIKYRPSYQVTIKARQEVIAVSSTVPKNKKEQSEKKFQVEA